MKRLLMASVIVPACFLISCIKNEPRNSEADILSCSLPSKEVTMEPTISNNRIMILGVKGQMDIKNLAPTFTVTPGATLQPPSGTPRDFTTPQKYTVTSEDGMWIKQYEVFAWDGDIPTVYDFELWERQAKYAIPYAPVYLDKYDENGNLIEDDYPDNGLYENPKRDHEKLFIWSSGNAGYGIANGNQPEDFPTCYTSDHVNGTTGVKLVTKRTGFSTFPLAAGNLFIGQFNGENIMADPLGGTKFGVPFAKKPVGFKGNYKYTATNYNYTDEHGVEHKDVRDSLAIYALLYERGNGGIMDAREILIKDDRVVAMAMLYEGGEPNDWTEFDIRFNYEDYPVAFDQTKCDESKYYLTIVFSSSYWGAFFRGGTGSTLYVDAVELICEGDEGWEEYE